MCSLHRLAVLGCVLVALSARAGTLSLANGVDVIYWTPPASWTDVNIPENIGSVFSDYNPTYPASESISYYFAETPIPAVKTSRDAARER